MAESWWARLLFLGVGLLTYGAMQGHYGLVLVEEEEEE